MYDCLDIAKGFINKHHKDQSFFSDINLDLFILEDFIKTYGHIEERYPNFRIGIHPSLSGHTPENIRMLIVILVHQLLHAVYPNWTYDKISVEEKTLQIWEVILILFEICTFCILIMKCNYVTKTKSKISLK